MNSALQRARSTLRDRMPERRTEWRAATAPTEEERELLRRYVDAHERADVDGAGRAAARGRAPDDAAAPHLVRGPRRDHDRRGAGLGPRVRAAAKPRPPARTASRRSPTTCGAPGESEYLPLALDVLRGCGWTSRRDHHVRPSRAIRRVRSPREALTDQFFADLRFTCEDTTRRRNRNETSHRQHVHLARRSDAGRRRPARGSDGRLHTRRLGRALLRGGDDGAGGRSRPLRVAARPRHLRDVRGALALRRGPDRGPAQQHPQARRLDDAEGGCVEQLHPDQRRRSRVRRGAEAPGRPGDPGSRERGPDPDAARTRSDRRVPAVDIPRGGRVRKAVLRRRRRPRRAEATGQLGLVDRCHGQHLRARRARSRLGIRSSTSRPRRSSSGAGASRWTRAGSGPGARSAGAVRGRGRS